MTSAEARGAGLGTVLLALLAALCVSNAAGAAVAVAALRGARACIGSTGRC